MTHDRAGREHAWRRRRRRGAVLLMVGTLVGCAAACGGGNGSGGEGAHRITIGLVTKTEANPFFVTLRHAATAAAEKNDARLIALAGKFDGDNEGQVNAVESLIARGVNGILITPSNTTGILGAIKEARRQGILVIALDTATQPENAVDATYATDNFKAGHLQGAYLRAVLGGRTPRVFVLDGTAGSEVSQDRHDGFLEGFGIKEGSPAIVGRADANGDRNTAQAATENLLLRSRDVNTIYTINEPVAAGAYGAIASQGLTRQVTIGSIDGSCDGVRDVRSGTFAATVMQFPVRMATDGVDAVLAFARSGKRPSGFTDTGTVLITDRRVRGVPSQTTAWGLQHCWG